MKLSHITETARTIDDLQDGWYVGLHEAAGHAKFNITDGTDASLGHAMLKRVRVSNNETGQKDSLWIITLIESGKKIQGSATPFRFTGGKSGPLLYDLIIEYATQHGVGLLPAEALAMVIGRCFDVPHKGSQERAKSDGYYFTKTQFKPYQDRNHDWVHGITNSTSHDAKKVYARIFDTQNGLTGPITITNADRYVQNYIGFNHNLIERVYGLSFNKVWEAIRHIEKGEPVDDKYQRFFDEAKQDGWDGKGWPQTAKMGKAIYDDWATKHPYLAVVYSKTPPIATTLLKQRGLLIKGPYQ